MDLYKAIQELYAEKEKLERIIKALEELQQKSPLLPELAEPPKRRGRKSMSSKERQQVSRRMKEYWEQRRKREGDEPKGPGGGERES